MQAPPLRYAWHSLHPLNQPQVPARRGSGAWAQAAAPTPRSPVLIRASGRGRGQARKPPPPCFTPFPPFSIQEALPRGRSRHGLATLLASQWLPALGATPSCPPSSPALLLFASPPTLRVVNTLEKRDGRGSRGAAAANGEAGTGLGRRRRSGARVQGERRELQGPAHTTSRRLRVTGRCAAERGGGALRERPPRGGCCEEMRPLSPAAAGVRRGPV